MTIDIADSGYLI